MTRPVPMIVVAAPMVREMRKARSSSSAKCAAPPGSLALYTTKHQATEVLLLVCQPS